MTVTNLTPPSISGQARQGQTLSTTNGTWDYDLDYLEYDYSWLRCDTAGANCLAIGGATLNTYVLQAADVGSRIRSEVTATEHSNPPGGFDPPITISTGGTYSGNWESVVAGTSPVTITTSQPVTITNSQIQNLSGQNSQGVGALINSQTAGAQVTVRNTYFTGGWNRCIFFSGGKSLTVENCTIDKTTGIYVTHPQAGDTVTIRYNVVTNIQGVPIPSGGYSTQFVQFDTSSGAGTVGWNQVVNEFGDSLVEDLISIFQTSNKRVHDNFLRGGYPATVNSPRSGYGILVGDYGGSNNLIEDNQVVATYGGIGVAGGNGNIVRDNRLVDDHKLDDGTQLTSSDGVGIYAYSNPAIVSGTQILNNVVGWMGRVGGVELRNDFYLPAGQGTTSSGNTSMANPIDFSDEEAEYTSWQAKLVSNGITIGAP